MALVSLQEMPGRSGRSRRWCGGADGSSEVKPELRVGRRPPLLIDQVLEQDPAVPRVRDAGIRSRNVPGEVYLEMIVLAGILPQRVDR